MAEPTGQAWTYFLDRKGLVRVLVVSVVVWSLSVMALVIIAIVGPQLLILIGLGGVIIGSGVQSVTYGWLLGVSRGKPALAWDGTVLVHRYLEGPWRRASVVSPGEVDGVECRDGTLTLRYASGRIVRMDLGWLAVGSSDELCGRITDALGAGHVGDSPCGKQ